MENYKNGDVVYVPFVLEVRYEDYKDGTHYAFAYIHHLTLLNINFYTLRY